MRNRLAMMLLRLALRVLGKGPTATRRPMDNDSLAQALTVPAEDPRFRACMELLHRYELNARKESYAERNVARNPNKAIFYAASAGTAADLCELLEATREAAMTGKALPQI